MAKSSSETPAASSSDGVIFAGEEKRVDATLC